MSIPFPLASGRYEVGPGMRRFGQAGQGFPAEEGHFRFDEALGATLAAKVAALRQAACECHLVAPRADAVGLRSALREAFALLAAEHPARVALDADGVTLRYIGVRLAGWEAPKLEVLGPGADFPAVVDWLSRQEGLSLLGAALGLAVQEDLAIVRGPGAPGETDVLEWLHVCLPSNWAPATKIGGSFGAVHEPVVHSDRLIAPQSQIVRAMIHSGPFVRYVWGLERDPALCHNPRLHQAPPWPADAPPGEIAERTWFRVERQTTHGWPALNRALFTIRYYVAPLTEAAADPWQRERLASALVGMTDEELRYKGLAPIRDKLVAWLTS